MSDAKTQDAEATLTDLVSAWRRTAAERLEALRVEAPTTQGAVRRAVYEGYASGLHECANDVDLLLSPRRTLFHRPLRTTFPVETEIHLPDGRTWAKISDLDWTVTTPPIEVDGEEYAGAVIQITDMEIALQFRRFIVVDALPAPTT